MSGRPLIERTNTFAAFAMAAGGLTVPGPAQRPAQYPNGTNHPVVMTDLLWPFFMRYSLP
jgi:hypothetical protein